MKLKAIHIFLILLGSLLLCGVLGGKCSIVEGMSTSKSVSYTGPAGDKVIVQAPPGKQNELSNISSSARGLINQGESDISSLYSNVKGDLSGNKSTTSNKTIVGSLLSTIKSDVKKVKDNIKSLANKTTIEYSSSGPKTSSASAYSASGQLPAVQHSNVSTRKAPITITKSQIPTGDEDLYILKSQIVPPVCPACPTTTTCPRESPCPPCPPCARCPEPAFECKKVPNYSSNNSQYLPRPVLSDFSQFGM